MTRIPAHRPRRWAAVAAVMLSVFGLVLAGSATSASAADGRWRSWATGLCLDGEGSTGNVFTKACDNSPNQSWSLSSTESTYPAARIVHGRSGLCIASNRPGVAYLTRCDPINKTMLWDYLVTARPDGKAVWHFFNKQTNQCLASDGSGRVYMSGCSGNLRDWA